MVNEEKQLIGEVNVKHGYVWVGVTRAITKISTSDVVPFFKNLQSAQLIR
jgi:hypothetical protein